jgi:hypothetical protein
MSYKSENSSLNEDVRELEEGIETVKALDEGELGRISSIMENFVPKTDDTLRFLALNEAIASSAGVGISSVSLENEKESQIGKDALDSQADPDSIQSQDTAQTQDIQLPTQQSSEGSFIVNVAVKGFYSSLLRFVLNYQVTDRLVGLKEVTIAGQESILTATLTVELPLGASAEASSDDDLALTQKEKDLLKSIEDNTLFTTSPAKDPLGRPDPFN